jgi:hypothetical protein
VKRPCVLYVFESFAGIATRLEDSKRGGLAGPRLAMQLQPMQSRGMMAAVAAMGCPQHGGPANYKYGRNVQNFVDVGMTVHMIQRFLQLSPVKLKIRTSHRENVSNGRKVAHFLS